MPGRMTKLDRVLMMIHALAESAEGLTLDELAARLCVGRRTVERMRDLVGLHFDLAETLDDRQKRFRIVGRLNREYTRPTAGEVAALQTEVDSQRVAGQARLQQLETLLAKVKGALDDREKRRIDADLDALTRLQRGMVTAGPSVIVPRETITAIQRAMLEGRCLDFDYIREGQQEPVWRRVIPYGLVHGSMTYLLGKIPNRSEEPAYFRLDRMINPRSSEILGIPPDDWDIGAYLDGAFGVWRDAPQDVVLRVRPAAAARASSWRFHIRQQVEDLDDGGLRIRFHARGMRELADHLFTWGGDVVIEGPEILVAEMRQRITAAMNALPS
jgi:proteasome accessory factor B